MQSFPAAPATLRERNRAETWLTLHDVASRLATEHGPGDVTVEAVAREAGVSPRTFFNYFETKEDAVLGTTAPHLPGEDLEAFLVDDRPLLHRVVHLVAAVVRTASHPGAFVDRRVTLVARHPELQVRMRRLLSTVETMVQDALTADGAPGVPEAFHSPERLRGLVILATSVMRYAYALDPVAAASGDPDIADRAIGEFRQIAGDAL